MSRPSDSPISYNNMRHAFPQVENQLAPFGLVPASGFPTTRHVELGSPAFAPHSILPRSNPVTMGGVGSFETLPMVRQVFDMDTKF